MSKPQTKRDQQETPKDWIPWKLKWWCCTIILVLEVGIFVTIIVLAVLSDKHNGFVRVSEEPLSIGNSNLNRRLLWSALPGALISLLNIAFAMVVGGVAERQPYVELFEGQRKERSARHTIMLDYPSYPLFYNWVVALRNRHLHLSAAMFTQLICSFAVVPLMSNVFLAAPTLITKMDFPLSTSSAPNLSTLSIETNFQPAIDLSGAIHSYGARPPVWMTSDHSLVPFFPAASGNVGNITAQTTAYYSRPQCRIVDRSEMKIEYLDTALYVSFVDRGCNVSAIQISWPETQRSYSQSWFQSCSDAGDPQDLVGVFAGLYSAIKSEQHISNATVISCLPLFYNASVDLTMSFNGSEAVSLLSMSPLGDATRIQLLNFRTLNSNLPLYRLAGISDEVKVNALGNIVHSYASVLSPGAEFQGEVYLRALNASYSTLFAALATTTLLEPLPFVEAFDGDLTTSSLRLHVSTPVACALNALMLLMIICTVTLTIHVRTSTSVLTEDPKGLLGRALLFVRSDVLEFASELKDDNPDAKNLRDLVKEHYTVKSSECWYAGDIGKGKICMSSLSRVEPPAKRGAEQQQTKDPRPMGNSP